METVIAQGTKEQPPVAAELDPKFKEGDKGELRLYVNGPTPQIELDQIQQNLLESGVVLTQPVMQQGDIIFIRFVKGEPVATTQGIGAIAIGPVAIIALVVGGVAAIWGSVAGWQLIKDVKAIPSIVWVGLGGLLLWLVARDLPKRKEA
jgi:hypothetical protein